MDCPVSNRCGGCRHLAVPYDEQLRRKQRTVERLLRRFGPVAPIVGMDAPFRYRRKVEAAFGLDAEGRVLCGKYREGTHDIVPTTDCLIEDGYADAVVATVRDLLPRLGIPVHDERTRRGLVRHVLVRRSYATDETMVVLVVASPTLRARRPFLDALLDAHPDITTVVLNVNDRRTSMVLGDRETVLHGPGFIEDRLCGLRFRLSARSFYQVNPPQTEKLYRLAVDGARLTGRERVLDAYCGIGTIGLVASLDAGSVLGVELNPAAARDAAANARLNHVRNARFLCGDAGRFMASCPGRVDAVFLDPPRSGCDARFLSALARLAPRTVAYVSCNPETLARDLGFLTTRGGYEAYSVAPVDMFPHTDHVETVVHLDRRRR